MTRRLLVHAFAWAHLVAAPHVFAQAPPRDKPGLPSVGRAAIAGVVVGATDAQPIRRARLALVDADQSKRREPRTTVTDDEGKFRFRSLPPGRYVLTATKQGYVSATYGAKRPNRPGTEIPIGSDAELTTITLRMNRASVISGAIADQNGDPLPGAAVAALQIVVASSGQRQLTIAAQATSDDRGEYRIWGLADGEYVVCAWLGAGELDLKVGMTRTTDADVKRAIAELTAGAAQPGMPQRAIPAIQPAAVEPQTIGYAPIYYPGTFVAANAATLRLATGEERTAIDLEFSLLATSRIAGTVFVPSGIDRRTVTVELLPHGTLGFTPSTTVRRSVSAAGGVFSFSSVPPGTYTLLARATTPLSSRVSKPTMWATETVIANGQTVDGVELRLQPYLSLSGRAGFEGGPSRPDVRGAQITLIPVQLPEQRWIPSATAHPDSDGHFGFDVIPGNYRLAASFPGTAGSVSPWWLMEATIDKHDALREAVAVREPIPAHVTFTDRVAHLTGAVLSTAGAPAAENSVLIFSADRTLWMPETGVVRLTKPSSDGRYAFTNLAPGNYFLAAVADMAPLEMFDPVMLERLSRSAVRVTLVEGDKKVQDLPGGRYH